MENILKELRKELKNSIDEKTISGAQNFFKEKIKFYGVKVPLVNKIAGDFFKKHIEDLSKAEVFNLCAQLWESGYLEESFIACNWSYSMRKTYEKKDFKVFEGWLEKYVDNWASCDTLCNHTIAETVEMYPELINSLKKWTASKNRWVKRGSAVTLIIPARKGLFLKEIFETADALLTDEDDLVQKGYGWMLKAASEAHQKEVFDYVMKHKSKMPRTALRYAIEKMPDAFKKKAMAK
jgi:3-methyladenine DNA glycosylase AlkD